MPKIYLTDTLVASLKCSADKDQELFWDHPKTAEGTTRRGAVRGLGLRITQQGIMAFVHSYVYAGKRRRIVLGSPPIINVSAARLMVTQRELQLSSGEQPDAFNPSGRRIEKAPTVRNVLDGFWESRMQNNSYCPAPKLWAIF